MEVFSSPIIIDNTVNCSCALPYPAVRVYGGTAHIFGGNDIGALVLRSNGGALMTDVLPANCPTGIITIVNNDTSAILTVRPGGGASLDIGSLILGPGQRGQVLAYTDGIHFYALNVPTRLTLPALMQFYVDSEIGSDGNNGLSPTNLSGAGPWQSGTHAYNWTLENCDLGPGNTVVQINLNGYFESISCQVLLFGGNSLEPCTLNFTSGSSVAATDEDVAIFVAVGAGVVIQADGPDGVTLSSENYEGVRSATQAQVNLGPNINFGACGNAHVFAGLQARVAAINTYNVVGDSARMIYCNGGIYDGGATWNFVGTRTFSDAVARASTGGQLLAAETFIGNVSEVVGRKYFAENGGVISGTNSGDPDYFPGNTTGDVDNGGVYSTD
jgi:hypothetical protein